MNFEELLETRDIRKTTKLQLPYGIFYKRLIDGKYSNFVEFHDEVADHVAFSNCVRTEVAGMEKISNKHQLHFVPNEGDGGVYAIAVEVGNFVTFEQLINDNPAVLAREDFATEVLRDLVELTEVLNDKGICHVCFAPNNVLARKNDSSVRLLCHGSFYSKLDQDVLYDGVEDYVRLLLGVVPDKLGLVLRPDNNSHLVRPGGRDEVVQPLNKYSGQLIQQDATLSFSLVVDELEHPGSE